MKTLLTAIVIAAASISSHAGEFIVHTVSIHTQKTYVEDDVNVRDLNNTNAGLGYRTDAGLTVGVYRNSYYKNTVYVTQEFMYNNYVGGVVGGATGYKGSTGYFISPLVAALVKIPLNDTVSINTFAMPKYRDLVGVAHVVVAYKF